MRYTAPPTSACLDFQSRGRSQNSLDTERFSRFATLETPESNWRILAVGSAFESTSVMRGICVPGAATKLPGSDPDLLTIGIVLSGEIDLRGQTGETVRVLPHECFHIRSSATCALLWPQPSRFILATAPLANTEEYGASVRSDCGRIYADEALVQPTASFMDTVVDRPTPDTDLTRFLVERLLQDQLGALLLSSEGHPERQATTHVSIYQQAKALITAKHAEYGFTPKALADSVGVSLRLLQKIFANHNETIADEIRHARTRHARLLLDNQRYADLTKTQIANYAGFTSAAVMRRALAEDHADSDRSMQTHH